MIRAIVFDMDDTLYQEKDYILSGLKMLDQWILEKYGKPDFYSTAKHLFDNGERKKIFNRALNYLGIEDNYENINMMIDAYRSHQPSIDLLEDAVWVLNNIRDSVKLGLISDGYLISQRNKVDALQLNNYIHTIILSDELGRKYWKPSVVPYEEAVRQLGCNHDQCVYVGDNVGKDFITAKKLGWTTINVNRGEGIYSGRCVSAEYHAHYQINSLREMKKIPILRKLFKRI